MRVWVRCIVPSMSSYLSSRLASALTSTMWPSGGMAGTGANVWDYVSQNALNATSKSKLALHPTAKPVALVADAIRDCSNRGGIILDPFGGAGTTLIAAERTGRRARLIEIDPHFVDITIERWQRLTGRIALHADSAQPFVRSCNSSAGTEQTISSPDVGKK